MSVYTPTEKEKAEILSHIYYEILRTFIMFEAFNDPYREVREDWVLQLLHARVVADFFEEDEMKQDNVVSKHFGFDPRKIFNEKERVRLNKDLAHLTYSRLRHTPESRVWPIREFLTPLHTAAVAFIEHIILNPPKLTSQPELEKWKTLLYVMKTPDAKFDWKLMISSSSQTGL